MSDTFITDHSVIITTIMFIMFGACIAYTVWVMVLDIRETRDQALHDEAMQCEAYAFQAAVQASIAANDTMGPHDHGSDT